MEKKLTRWREGAVVQIPLGDGWHTYGRLRREPTISFYDSRTREQLDVETVVCCPVLFSIWVMRRSLASWPLVHVRPLDASLEGPESFVKRCRATGKTDPVTT